jgi:N-acetylglucosaminyldiphosphoundecaprenol N-acetyl-beta-D-mannosaminyltransferase
MTRAPGAGTATVLGARIDALDWRQCVDRIAAWARARESRCVCLCNAHSVVSARREPAFARVLDSADLALPDGAPVAWTLRRRGFAGQPRLSGPELMWRCCERAAREGLPIFLYGGSDATLRRLTTRLAGEFPGLTLAGAQAPPFRALTGDEDAQAVRTIAASGARIVFVALGCPKQEAWMAARRGAVPAVMIGVGAAFDFHAGTLRRAPRWMQDYGLEWLHRLLAEPQRLWRRYLVTNTLFVAYVLADLLGGSRRKASRSSPAQ